MDQTLANFGQFHPIYFYWILVRCPTFIAQLLFDCVRYPHSVKSIYSTMKIACKTCANDLELLSCLHDYKWNLKLFLMEGLQVKMKFCYALVKLFCPHPPGHPWGHHFFLVASVFLSLYFFLAPP